MRLPRVWIQSCFFQYAIPSERSIEHDRMGQHFDAFVMADRHVFRYRLLQAGLAWPGGFSFSLQSLPLLRGKAKETESFGVGPSNAPRRVVMVTRGPVEREASVEQHMGDGA